MIERRRPRIGRSIKPCQVSLPKMKIMPWLGRVLLPGAAVNRPCSTQVELLGHRHLAGWAGQRSEEIVLVIENDKR